MTMADPGDDREWCLRLLASVDLVGSTAYKAREQYSLIPDWANTFREFFGQFPERVRQSYALPLHGTSTPLKKLATWKFVGDEILFEVTIRDHLEALTHVLALKKAIRSYTLELQEKHLPLALKCTAWLAGFPVQNTAVRLHPQDGSTARVIDFIGPAVDLGFRIARYASERHFIVAADLAIMLLDGAHHCDVDDKHIQLHLMERGMLKGIDTPGGYPVVWLPSDDIATTDEELLLGIERKTNPQKLKLFLSRFIESSKQFRLPFVVGDKNPKYGTVPPELENARRKLSPQVQAEESQRGYTAESRPSKRTLKTKGKSSALPPPKLPKRERQHRRK